MQCYQITDFEAHEEMHLEKVHKKRVMMMTIFTTRPKTSSRVFYLV